MLFVLGDNDQKALEFQMLHEDDVDFKGQLLVWVPARKVAEGPLPSDKSEARFKHLPCPVARRLTTH